MNVRSQLVRDHTFLYVADHASLDRFCQEWLPAIEDQVVALDIEEDREYRYHARVSLIQLTVPGHDAVLDPMLLDPALTAAVVEAVCLLPARVIVHGANNDVGGLKRDFRVGPGTLRDTQIAARFLGREQFGLAALLDQHFGIQLDKSLRRTDWSRRPLAPEHLAYARGDTTHLLALYDELVDALAPTGWLDAFEEESEALGALPADPTEQDPWGWTRTRGLQELDDAERARIHVLWAWRDNVGRQLDIHPARVIQPWALLHIARRPAELARTARGFDHRAARLDLDALYQDLVHAEPIGERPRSSRRPPRAPERGDTAPRLERLLTWRNDAAHKAKLDAGFLAPRNVLEAVARSDARDLDGLLALPEVRRWRVARYGEAWLRLLRNV